MWKLYLAIALAVVWFGSLAVTKYYMNENDKLTKVNIVLEKENGVVKEEAGKWAARPRTNVDLVDRLCEWADNIKGDYKPTDEEIRVCPR